MKKGKLKKEKKYFSIMLVPHFAGKFKVLKFSTPYSRLVGMVVVTLVSMIVMFFFVMHTTNQNLKLQASVMQLSELNIEQKHLISDKSAQLDELKQSKQESDKSIQEYVSKYKEMMDTYITPKTSRSGDRDDKSFIEDVSELRDLLNNIGQLTVNGSVSLEDLSDTETKLKQYIDSVPTLWPTVGRISSKFGDRQDPLLFSTKFHSGLDIAANYGEDIKASADGTVVFSGYKAAYGNCIFIEHEHGLTTVYGHAQRLISKIGDTVKKGDVIAKVGSSGRSTGPHLHFEIRIGDNVVDPMKYLDQ